MTSPPPTRAAPTAAFVVHDDGRGRCPWAGRDPLYVAYHDTEWGVPERDDRALFEKLVLDGFQAGLAWITILRKREAFRRAFGGFDPEVVARFGEADVDRLMNDAGIVRNRAKIVNTVAMARFWLAERDRGPGFGALIWSFVDGVPVQNGFATPADVPTESAASRALSRHLRSAGIGFCGPTIVYAFMQAVGMVNDHVATCFRHAECRHGGGGRP